MNPLKQLKDIKPNVQITDYQFYVFIFLCIAAATVLIYIIYRFANKRKTDPCLLKLKNLDFENSKKTAYEFTEYARHFLNEENKKNYTEIVKELEKYKYKPIVGTLDEKTVLKIKKFIEDIK